MNEYEDDLIEYIDDIADCLEWDAWCDDVSELDGLTIVEGI